MKRGYKRNPSEPDLTINCNFDEQQKMNQLNGIKNDKYRLKTISAGVEVYPIDQAIAISSMSSQLFEDIRRCLNAYYGFNIKKQP